MLSRTVVFVTFPLVSTCMFLFRYLYYKPRFPRQHLWFNIDTVLRKALCEMKLDSFCHLQGEKIPKTFPLIKPFSPHTDLKELMLSYTPIWLELSQEPLALESIVLRHLDATMPTFPNLLNSKHLTCIVLHIQSTFGAEPLNKWLEESPVYPSLRAFSFAVNAAHRNFSAAFMLTKLLPFLSSHTFLTYLDIDLYVDGSLGMFAAILQQMKALEFFGCTARLSGGGSDHANHKSIFEYLRPLLSALPPRLGGLEIGTWHWVESKVEVCGPCATKESTGLTAERCTPRSVKHIIAPLPSSFHT